MRTRGAVQTLTPPGNWTKSAAEEHKPVVLLVDAVRANRRTLRAILTADSYRMLECGTAREALEILARDPADLVIVDSALPAMSGVELCRWLKADRQTQFIQVLMLAGTGGIPEEINALASGADEVLAEPFRPELTRARVSAMLRRKVLTDGLERAEAILFALAQAVEQRDRRTGEHCHRLAVYSVALGKAMGRSQVELLALYRGGYLHDIGKVGIPDAILLKPGSLTAYEWEIMQSHTIRGQEICGCMKSLAPVLPIIRSHHERWDGTGYPDALSRNEIPLLARILQVCDIYDALTSPRCYKPAFEHDEAVRVLRDEVDRGWRDPEIVELFLDVCRDPLPGIMLPAVRETSGMLSMHHAIEDSLSELAAPVIAARQ